MNNPLVLRSATLRLELDPITAAPIRLTTSDGQWPILDRPELGVGFSLLLPLQGRRANYAAANDAPPPVITVDPDGDRVTARWDTVRSTHGGRHDIGVTTTVRADGNRIVFAIQVDNRSELVVENVHFPVLGDVAPPDQNRTFHATSHLDRTQLWPRWEPTVGFCSVRGPTYFPARANALGAVGPPVTPFVLLGDDRRGLYWGVDLPSDDLLTWQGRLHPGWGDSVGWQVPREADGRRRADVSARFETVHVPYVLPGESRDLTPIALSAFDGDWSAGADVYVARREEWHRPEPPATPAWTHVPHAWQQLQVNSAEDTLHVDFGELVEVARECAQHGVTALQVTGWNDGGQDRNNPSHDPDPRLGGRDALAAAIRDCQALGVKVVLFTKFVWADRATGRFRDELSPMAVRDPYGDFYQFPGFRYDTTTQLLDINTHRFVPMCFGDARWVDVCADEFATVAELGADGILNDEALHHTPALLCFDTAHGHRYGAPVYAHDREFGRHLQSVGPEAAEFLYGAELCYDWLFEAYPLSYTRTNAPGHIPLSRYLRPDALIMAAVTGYGDRSMIHQCLRYQYVASYEPQFFKGRLPELESTIGYGRQMDELRTELADWFWNGRFRDKVGVGMWHADGRPFDSYAVFEPANGRRPGLVVVNDTATPVIVRAEATDPVRHHYRLIDDPEWRDAAHGIALPARSAAVSVPVD